MANAIYPKYKQALLDASTNTDINDGDVRMILLDLNDDAYNAADEFLSDILAGARVAVSTTLQATTVVNGVFDADNITLTGVSGDVCEALIFYVHTGVEGTSRLVAFMDTGVSGFPITPDGGNINVTFNGSGIFAL